MSLHGHPGFGSGYRGHNFPLMYLNNPIPGRPAPGPMPASFGALGLARGPMYRGSLGRAHDLALDVDMQRWQDRHPMGAYGGGMPRLNGGYGWY